MAPVSFDPCFAEIPSAVVDGDTLVFHRWSRDSADEATTPLVVVLFFHGLHVHGRYATVKYQAAAVMGSSEDWQHKRVVCYSVDLPGHGAAKGTRGLIRSADDVVAHGRQAAEHVHQLHPSAPLVLAGTSMGGAIALAVALENDTLRSGQAPAGTHGTEPLPIASLCLTAPLIGVHDKDLPHPLVVGFLRNVAKLVPSLAVLSVAASNPDLQYKDPARREECVSDELEYKGRLRLGSANALLDLTLRNQESLGTLRTAFLILAAERECVVDPEKAKAMMESTGNVANKKLFVCREALHGIFCEPDETRMEPERELRAWVAGTAPQ